MYAALENLPWGRGSLQMEAFVDDLFALISEFKLVKPVICGLSMGGYIALRAVERDQDKFKALILSDTKAEADDNAAKIKRCAGINNELIPKGLRNMLRILFLTASALDISRITREIIIM